MIEKDKPKGRIQRKLDLLKSIQSFEKKAKESAETCVTCFSETVIIMLSDKFKEETYEIIRPDTFAKFSGLLRKLGVFEG